MFRVEAKMLAVLGGLYALVVFVVYTLVVARRLLTEELATLTVFNASYAIALTILGYVTAWHPRVFARKPERFAELAGAGLMASLLTWAPSSLRGHIRQLDLTVIAIGLVLLAPSAWSTGVRLSVHRQRTWTC